jgi:hypothetical protein
MFRVLSAPIIRSAIKKVDAIIGTVHVSVWFKSVERCPRSGVYFTMSWPWHTEIDSRPWTSFNGFKPHRHMNCTYDCICSFNCISLCHGQIRVLIWPWHSEIDSRPWTSFNGFEPHRHMNCTYDCICSFNCAPDDGCRNRPKHVE